MPRKYPYGGRRPPRLPPSAYEIWEPPVREPSDPSGAAAADAPATTIAGIFQRFNRTTGDWGLFTDDGVTTGKIAYNGPGLDGLRVGGYYQFNCIEETEVDLAGRAKRILYLQSIADG